MCWLECLCFNQLCTCVCVYMFQTQYNKMIIVEIIWSVENPTHGHCVQYIHSHIGDNEASKLNIKYRWNTHTRHNGNVSSMVELNVTLAQTCTTAHAHAHTARQLNARLPATQVDCYKL